MTGFATVGSGKIVKNFLNTAKEAEGFKYALAYSRSADKARTMKEEFGAAECTDSLSAAAESDKVDAVYIASPNSLHFEQTRLMLEHGKHVLCEKPVCTNYDEYACLSALADERSLVFMEAMRHLHAPGAAEIKKNMSRLGKLRYADLHYFQYSSRYDNYKRGIIENAFRKEFSNGALMDIGIYCIGLSVYLFGEPEDIKAESLYLETGVDGQGSVQMRFEDGMLVNLAYSKISDYFAPSSIVGEGGYMTIDHVSDTENIEMMLRDGTREHISCIDERDAESIPASGAPGMKDAKPSLSNMSWEIKDFISFVESAERGELFSDSEQGRLYRMYRDVSAGTMRTADRIRKELGLVFPADEKRPPEPRKTVKQTID